MTDLASIFSWFDPVSLEQWMIGGGYVVLFCSLFAGGLGLPLPEDVPLIVAGALIASGHLSWPVAGLVAWSAIMLGDLVLYQVGLRYGRNISRVPVIGRHITPARLARVERLFEKYGIWVVAIGRLFAGIRGAMVVTAGTIRYSPVKFLIADGLAAIVSGGSFMFLGYWLGNNLPQLARYVSKGKGIAIGVLALAAVIGLAVWWLRSRRRTRGPDSVVATANAVSGTTEPTGGEKQH